MSKGSLVYPDGEKYFGELQDGAPNGEGTMTFPDGSKYVGEFYDGQFSGQGTFTTFSGTYFGEWKSGVPHGQGTFTYSDGTVQSGEWDHGHFKGDPPPDEANKQLSMFEDEGEPTATAAAENKPDLAKYIIHEENNVSPREQPGREHAARETWSFSTTSSSAANQRDAAFHTIRATVRLKDGVYTGELNKGIPHGKGTLTSAEGTKYTGRWIDGVMEGEFTVRAPDGKTFKRKFRQGILQEPKKQMVVSFKLMPGRDDDLIEWLENLGEGEKSFYIRQALREKVSGKKPY